MLHVSVGRNKNKVDITGDNDDRPNFQVMIMSTASAPSLDVQGSLAMPWKSREAALVADSIKA